jgi:hypothetical protein
MKLDLRRRKRRSALCQVPAELEPGQGMSFLASSLILCSAQIGSKRKSRSPLGRFRVCAFWVPGVMPAPNTSHSGQVTMDGTAALVGRTLFGTTSTAYARRGSLPLRATPSIQLRPCHSALHAALARSNPDWHPRRKRTLLESTVLAGREH